MARWSRFLTTLALLAALSGAVGSARQPPAAGDPSAQRDDSKPSGGQDQSPAPSGGQTPVFRTGINFVRVDVIVTDKTGAPVDNLKPEDFEITEAGKPQAIETFKLVSLDGGRVPGDDGPPRAIRTDSDEELEASRDDVRLFAIFLDDYHTRQSSAMGARDKVARFVETQLGPSDMIGLMYPLEPVSAVRMTRNHDAVAAGIRQFEGRKYDYKPKNDIEEAYVYRYPTETVEKIRNEVSLSALKSLIVHMGGLKEGRKALILVSEGYSNIIPPQMRDPIAGMPGFDNPQRQNPNAGMNDPLEDRAQTIAGWDMESDLRELYTTANRNNVAIYAVDPRGLTANEFGVDGPTIGLQTDSQYLRASMETLRTLSLETDGKAILNTNDLTRGMKQIMTDSSAYYLIGYSSSVAATDGRFHEIKVKIKRPGLTLRSRKGYWAFTPQDAARASAPPTPDVPKPVQHALSTVSEPSTGRVIRSWIGTERGANGRTRVTFVWEPIPHAPGDAIRPGDQPVRVSLTAAGEDGSAYFRGRLPNTGPDAPPAPATTPPGASVSFDAPPGKMQLRVAVEGAASEVIDSEIRSLDIPDLTAPQTQLGTPEVFRARSAREMQQIRSDRSAVPTAAREFSRTDRILMRLPAYGPGTTPPAVTARLLNRAGTSMMDLPVAAAGDVPPQIDVPLASLAPGEYIVEVKASGDGGDATELVGFRVTS